MDRRGFVLGLLLVGWVLAPRSMAIAADSEPIVKPGQRVAIAGDSITQQKLYSRFMEMYLTACHPHLNLSVCQFGWGGERASRFYPRMKNDMGDFKPDVVTICYGMNDGSWSPFSPAIGQAYEQSMTGIVNDLKGQGLTVVVGSPGAVDTKYFVRTGLTQEEYNENLDQLKRIAQTIAQKADMPFANLHDAMMESMAKAKATLGDDYDVCGFDGVHPSPNGHLIMAYAFLKALNLDGQIAAIEIDMNGGGRGSPGHEVFDVSAGVIEVTSRRYPFCFTGDAKSSSGTRSMVPFVPFNDELNRFTLVVNNLAAEKATVQWENQNKTFSRADLERGINLAAEFIDNPFVQAFAAVDAAVQIKQNYETAMIQQQISGHPSMLTAVKSNPDLVSQLMALRHSLWKHHDQLAQDVRAAVKPVKHRLSVMPAE